MSVEISFGGTCRDIALLPENDTELRTFWDNSLAPAIYEDFRQNYLMARSSQITRNFPGELGERGCEVGGSVSIKF